MPAPPQTWTTRTLLAWMSEAFASNGLDAPKRMAEELLAHVLGCQRLQLYMDADRPAAPLERETLRGLVKRAMSHEPIQYLVGEESFYGLRFKVDPRVLIPRPSTSTLVDAVLDHVKGNPEFASSRESDAGTGLLIADICAGSGCIAVALAKNLPGARVIATDISPDAIALAQENAERLGVGERVDFERGDLLAALDEHPPSRGPGRLDVLASNPPYIPDDEWEAVEPNVKDHEPELALRASPDGMRFVNPLINDGPARLRAGGLLAIELAASRAGEALERARKHELLRDARIEKDSDGLDRVLVALRR